MLNDELALYNAATDRNTVTPMEPQPYYESEALRRLYNRIRMAIGAEYPEISQLDALYLFDAKEADRRWCDGMCSKFADGTNAIGILIDIIPDKKYFEFIMLHELAHLRIMDHSAVFHAHLDDMIADYNAATGSSIVNDYFGLNTDSRTDEKRRMH